MAENDAVSKTKKPSGMLKVYLIIYKSSKFNGIIMILHL